MTATPEGQTEGALRMEAGVASIEPRLAAALRRARLALLWERAWPAIVAPAVVVGLFLIVSWLGLWLVLPAYGRIIGLVAFAVLLAIAFLPALRLRWPTTGEALSRLDRESGLRHRPATALSDQLAGKPDDPVAGALWRAHIARMSAQLGALRAGLPAPRLAAIDTHAVRALVALGVVATFFMVPGDHVRRIATAFDWQSSVPPTPYRVDAWVTPPAYTGRAPVILPGLRSLETAQAGSAALPAAEDVAQATAINIPAGSELIVRLTGLPDARLTLEGGVALAPQEPVAEEDGAGKEGGDSAARPAPPKAAVKGDNGEQRYVIAADGSAQVVGPDGRTVAWRFRVQPDTPPVISLTRDPQASGRTAMRLSYKVEDDYGVVEAKATFTALPSPPPLHRLKNAPPQPAPRALVAAPDFTLPLPGGRARSGTAQTTRDFTESPWAGARVAMTLTARDEAGNVGEAPVRSFVLPARPFSNPLARALIEQRRTLALDANERPRVTTALDALAIAPERFTPDLSHYLGLRTARTRLVNARSDDDLRAVVDYLWEVAVRIEDGDMSDVEKRLRDAQQALQNALENDASNEEIARLTQELREAMNDFMKALAEQAQRDGNMASQPMDPNARAVRPQDLQKMLDRIEDMARNGARDGARQMLSELQNMLNGLQAGRQQQQQRGGQNQMSQALDDLGDMIRQQQRLRDRTFREGQRSEQGEQGEPSFNDLMQNQEQLREQLRELRNRMQQAQRERGQQPGQPGEEQQGQEGEGGLGQAEQAMREAEQAMREGDGTGAVDAQSEALQALRRGAREMADAMQSQGSDGEGQPGSPSGERAERSDPLGRPLRSRDYGDDTTVKVPDEFDMQRARRVLEELRRRFGESFRPQMELDYLERLLRDF